jgi:hypothetical protein
MLPRAYAVYHVDEMMALLSRDTQIGISLMLAKQDQMYGLICLCGHGESLVRGRQGRFRKYM